MLPLKDINPTRRTPFLTYGLLTINIGVFLWMYNLSAVETYEIYHNLSIIPAQIYNAPFALDNIMDVFRSMFLHGGWAHLLGNMLYLYLFADNVEDTLGGLCFLFLYFFSGIVAIIAQVLTNPTSMTPMVGASGAIAGVLGSYLILFPRVRVKGIVPLGIFFFWAEWPAWLVLILWFVVQLFYGANSLGVVADGGVAFFAHIGGFLVGSLLTAVILFFFPLPSHQHRQEILYERARRYRF